MDWDKLLASLTELEEHIESAGEDDHNPNEADGGDETYCRGCEIGYLAQRLKFEIEFYRKSRNHEGS